MMDEPQERSLPRNCEHRKVCASSLREKRARWLTTVPLRHLRSLRSSPQHNHQNGIRQPGRHPQFPTNPHPRRRYVRERSFHIHLRHQSKFPTRSAQGQMHAKNIPPEHRLRGECMLEHLARRLEASVEFECHLFWAIGEYRKPRGVNNRWSLCVDVIDTNANRNTGSISRAKCK